MSRPTLEVADVIRRHGGAFLQKHSTSRQQRRVMRAIVQCRTAALGGHLYQCDSCAHQVPIYNSCRNRHCPKCQSLAKAKWLEARQQELLPLTYYHVVFTLPDSLAQLARQNARVIYNLLFRTVSETLLRIAADPKHLGARLGFFAVLHTWGQTLSLHPHLHCVVPAGGLSLDRTRWIACRPRFFLPVRVLSALFRGLFLDYLNRAYEDGKLQFAGSLVDLAQPAAFNRLLKKARKKNWVVYAKRPFGGPQQVLDYLGRYTHRVAISNHRLLALEKGGVSFSWKDYRHSSESKEMTLEAEEFIRRFLTHVLPDGFQKIRYFGLMANRGRATYLALCRELIPDAEPGAAPLVVKDWKERYRELTGEDVRLCPACKRGRMIPMLELHPHASERTKSLTPNDSS
jgi:putative transposase/transposase-like zinc-binding protein